jgi:hypothetical protein
MIGKNRTAANRPRLSRFILNGCAGETPARRCGGFRAIGVRGVPGRRRVPPGRYSRNGCAGWRPWIVRAHRGVPGDRLPGLAEHGRAGEVSR